MALQSWKCVTCEKNFKVGDWRCAGGANHIVETKRYYMNDAPTVADASGNVDKHSTTQILNIPPEERTTGPDGNERVVPGGNVWFVRGIYETSDPRQQYWLDLKGGWCTKEQWEQAYLNDREKLDIQKMEVAALKQRLENERNELLAQVQSRG